MVAQLAPVVSSAPYISTPIAYRQITVTGTAASLGTYLQQASPPYSLSGLERSAEITVGSVAINYTSDGLQVPTASYGMPIAANASKTLSSNFANIMLISQGGSAVVNVTLSS